MVLVNKKTKEKIKNNILMLLRKIKKRYCEIFFYKDEKNNFIFYIYRK
jgi:hypothetical protein